MSLTPINLWAISGTVILLLLTLVGWFVATLHKQAMGKFDRLIVTVDKMVVQQAVHDEKLSNNNRNFQKIEEHQRLQDNTIVDLSTRLSIMETNK